MYQSNKEDLPRWESVSSSPPGVVRGGNRRCLVCYWKVVDADPKGEAACLACGALHHQSCLDLRDQVCAGCGQVIAPVADEQQVSTPAPVEVVVEVVAQEVAAPLEVQERQAISLFPRACEVLSFITTWGGAGCFIGLIWFAEEPFGTVCFIGAILAVLWYNLHARCKYCFPHSPENARQQVPTEKKG